MDLTSKSMKDGLNTVKQQQMAALSFSLRYASQEINLKQHTNFKPARDLHFFYKNSEKIRLAWEKTTHHLNAHRSEELRNYFSILNVTDLPPETKPQHTELARSDRILQYKPTSQPSVIAALREHLMDISF